MKDRFNRTINYLRISVTDRCNLRCVYCMPEETPQFLPEEDVITPEEIISFTRQAVAMGIRKVRLTGGEPLLRRGITDLVAHLSEIEGITDLSMTTNGILLAPMAQGLKQAGLHRVNVSLDTMDPETYRRKTRGGDINRVLEGLEKAKEARFDCIKLNCVIDTSSEEPDARQVARFAEEKGFEVRYIHRMDLEAGKYWGVEGGDGGNCAICNRIRLTCDGNVRPCLFNPISFSTRTLGNREAILQAVEAKPRAGERNPSCYFYAIGG